MFILIKRYFFREKNTYDVFHKILLPCIAGMAAVMAVQSGLVYKVDQLKSLNLDSAIYGRAASAMLFIFELFFSIGFQATVWLIPSEVLPLSIRTKGSALSTAANWICNFAVVKFTPIAIQNIRYKFYIIFAILNTAWLPVIALFLPETANKTLEQMDEIFATDGWHLERHIPEVLARADSAEDYHCLSASSLRMVLHSISSALPFFHCII